MSRLSSLADHGKLLDLLMKSADTQNKIGEEQNVKATHSSMSYPGAYCSGKDSNTCSCPEALFKVTHSILEKDAGEDMLCHIVNFFTADVPHICFNLDSTWMAHFSSV